ncbi:MAG: hypothetical protein ACE14S_11390 [Candidatus Bathyarchaeia archaeon]
MGKTTKSLGTPLTVIIGTVSILALVVFGSFSYGIVSETWEKVYTADTVSGIGYEASHIIQTNDGGFAILARKTISGTVYSLLVKTDALGNVEWNKTFTTNAFGYCLMQTNDNGFLVGGQQKGIARAPFGTPFLAKTDSSGTLQWNKTYYGIGRDSGYGYDSSVEAVVQTADGGYVLAFSYGWLAKVDASGVLLWNQSYAGNSAYIFALFQTDYEGLVLGGYTFFSDSDPWLLKVDSSGKAIWNKTYGTPGLSEQAYSVAKTSDNGYVLAGSLKRKVGLDGLPVQENTDVLMIKTDSSGNLQWNKTFGGQRDDLAYSVIQTRDGGFALIGYSTLLKNNGDEKNLWFIKTDYSGGMQWNKTYGKGEGHSVVQTDDGGYVLAGTKNVGHGGIWLIKTDENGVFTSPSVSPSQTPSPSSNLSPNPSPVSSATPTLGPSSSPSPSPTPMPKPIPHMNLTCKNTASQSGLKVEIVGSLTHNGSSLSGIPVLISYSINRGNSWNELTSLNTKNDGTFSALWFPSVTGNYMLRAASVETEVFDSASTEANLAVSAFEEGESVFSVSSNSTLSELDFNSQAKRLSFSVSGESGTAGYVNAYIPKSLTNDISRLRVYLDGDRINFATESQNDYLLLYFTYQHNMHTVSITVDAVNEQSQNPFENWIPYIAVVAVAVVVTAIAAVLVLKKKRNH